MNGIHETKVPRLANAATPLRGICATVRSYKISLPTQQRLLGTKEQRHQLSTIYRRSYQRISAS
nr:MAG TPA: hypothetical protein [Caudoviricetes sp.]